MHDILQLALNFHQSPSDHKDLTDPARPLPENIDLLLEIAAGEVESSTLSHDVAPTENISQELLLAATYFVEHVLFIPKGNHYRTLGVEIDANPEQIRKHYHLLLKLLHLDREDKSAEWNTSYAMRINHAYSVLRDPAKRRSYDQILSKQGIRIVKGDKHPGKESISPSPSPANSRPAVADIITAQKEGDLNKKTSSQVSPPAKQPVPEAKPTKSPFIAGNVNKAHGAANGPGKITATETLKEIDKGNKKAAVSPLTSKGLDSFQQLIKAPPAQQNWLVEIVKNNHAYSRTITVALSALLLVVVVIYVFQRDEGGTDVVTEVAQVDPSDVGSDDLGSAPDMPVASATTEGSGIPAPQEDNTTKTARLRESAAIVDAMPSGNDIETRRRHTIDDVATRNLIGNNSTRPSSSDGVRPGEKATSSLSGITGGGITRDVPKAQLTVPERRLPTKAVTGSNATSAGVIPPGQSEVRWPAVTEKPAIVEGKQVVSQPQVVAAAPSRMSPPQARSENNPVSDVPVKPESSPLPTAPAFVSMAPAPQVQQINNNISDRELGDFIADFVRGYEAGDLALFMNLFADDARTDDQSERQGIRKDYQELFQGTEKRQFIVENLQWKRENNNLATGEGGFKVIVQAKGDSALSSFVGKVSFHVQKGQQGIVIKRLIHTYGQ